MFVTNELSRFFIIKLKDKLIFNAIKPYSIVKNAHSELIRKFIIASSSLSLYIYYGISQQVGVKSCFKYRKTRNAAEFIW